MERKGSDLFFPLMCIFTEIITFFMDVFQKVVLFQLASDIVLTDYIRAHLSAQLNCIKKNLTTSAIHI